MISDVIKGERERMQTSKYVTLENGSAADLLCCYTNMSGGNLLSLNEFTAQMTQIKEKKMEHIIKMCFLWRKHVSRSFNSNTFCSY